MGARFAELMEGCGMKCPVCGEALVGMRNGLYECLACSVSGTFSDILELKHLIARTDALIEAKKMEIEYMLDARREVLIRGSATYLKKVLGNYGFRNIPDFKDGIRRIDVLVETKRNEIERLLDARREVLIRGSTTYLKALLDALGFGIPKPVVITTTRKGRKKSTGRTIGLMLASAQIGAFLDWFVNSFYGLLDGTIPMAQSGIPVVLLLESIILVLVATK
jgi:hypothetical protein